jgi:hypothetical protein
LGKQKNMSFHCQKQNDVLHQFVAWIESGGREWLRRKKEQRLLRRFEYDLRRAGFSYLNRP